MRPSRSWLVGLALLLAGAAPARAQRPPTPARSIEEILSVGDRVRVTTAEGRIFEGRVHRLSPASMDLVDLRCRGVRPSYEGGWTPRSASALSCPATLTLDLGQVSLIGRSHADGIGNGFLIGFAGGWVLQFGLAGMGGGPLGWGGLMGGGLFTGALVALLDLATPGWEEVYQWGPYQDGPQLTLSPLVRPFGAGVGVKLRF